MENIVKMLMWKVCPNFWLVVYECIYSRMLLGEEVRRDSNLQVGHGHAVQHVVAGLLDGTEQVVESPDINAWLLVRSQHGVGLPTTCRQGKTALQEGATSPETFKFFFFLVDSFRLQAETNRPLNLTSKHTWSQSIPSQMTVGDSKCCRKTQNTEMCVVF